MDPNKIESIDDWEEWITIHVVKCFMRIVNYHCKFVMGNANISTPLSDLSNKDRAWNWMDKCQASFYDLC